MSDEDDVWRTNYGANGRRSVYGDDGKIGEEYDPNFDQNLKGPSSGASAGRRRPKGEDVSGGIASLLIGVIGFAVRYAPFVLLAYYLARKVIPRYYSYEKPLLVSWGAAALLALIAVLIVRKLFYLVFSRPPSLAMWPLRILMFLLVTGLQFIAVVWLTFGFLSPNDRIPLSWEEVSVMTVVAAVIALPAGVLVAKWVWYRWNVRVFGE